MSYTITNQRSQSSFTAHPGETILDAALRDGRIFPYGCRSGTCGACKSTVLSGRVDYGVYEDFALSAEEIAQGKALLCQAIARQDVVIDVEEILTGVAIQIKKLPCKVTRLERLAVDVMRVFITPPKSQAFDFIPGQYVDIIMRDGKRRSFSIANLPAQAREDGLELHIRQVPGGHFTPKVFQAARERDLWRFEGPFGSYFLQSEAAQPLIMIAGGTGFAPIKALASQALEKNPAQPIHLFWGARDSQDLYLHDVAQLWARQHSNFTYTPVLSAAADATADVSATATADNSNGNASADASAGDATAAAPWRGARGWVHDSVLAHYADFSAHDVYASGPPVMIDAIRAALTTRGLRAERFFFDSFTYAPPG